MEEIRNGSLWALAFVHVFMVVVYRSFFNSRTLKDFSVGDFDLCNDLSEITNYSSKKDCCLVRNSYAVFFTFKCVYCSKNFTGDS